MSKLKRAVIYPIANGNERDCNFELLLSLRALHENLEEDVPVFVLSEKRPPYISDKVKFRRVNGYMDALRQACEIADEILWMNDDIFLLHKHKWDTFKDWIIQKKTLNSEDIHKLITANNKWRQRKGKVLQKLQNLGKTTHDFSTHTPYLYNTDLLKQVIEDFDFGYKTAIETAYGNFVGVPTREAFKLERHHNGGLPIDTSCYPTLNYDDKGANPHCRGYLLGRFPKASPYEMYNHPDLSKLLYIHIK